MARKDKRKCEDSVVESKKRKVDGISDVGTDSARKREERERKFARQNGGGNNPLEKEYVRPASTPQDVRCEDALVASLRHILQKRFSLPFEQRKHFTETQFLSLRQDLTCQQHIPQTHSLRASIYFLHARCALQDFDLKNTQTCFSLSAQNLFPEGCNTSPVLQRESVRQTLWYLMVLAFQQEGKAPLLGKVFEGEMEERFGDVEEYRRMRGFAMGVCNSVRAGQLLALQKMCREAMQVTRVAKKRCDRRYREFLRISLRLISLCARSMESIKTSVRHLFQVYRPCLDLSFVAALLHPILYPERTESEAQKCTRVWGFLQDQCGAIPVDGKAAIPQIKIDSKESLASYDKRKEELGVRKDFTESLGLLQ